MLKEEREKREAELTVLLRLLIIFAVVGTVAGVIYATGIGNGHRTAGILALALSVGCFGLCWRLAVIRSGIRAAPIDSGSRRE